MLGAMLCVVIGLCCEELESPLIESPIDCLPANHIDGREQIRNLLRGDGIASAI